MIHRKHILYARTRLVPCFLLTRRVPLQVWIVSGTLGLEGNRETARTVTRLTYTSTYATSGVWAVAVYNQSVANADYFPNGRLSNGRNECRRHFQFQTSVKPAEGGRGVREVTGVDNGIS